MPLQLPLPLPNNGNLQTVYDERLRSVESNRFGIAGYTEQSLSAGGVGALQGFVLGTGWNSLPRLGTLTFQAGASGGYIVYGQVYMGTNDMRLANNAYVPFISCGLVIDGAPVASTPITGSVVVAPTFAQGVQFVYGGSAAPYADHEISFACQATWAQTYTSPPTNVVCFGSNPSMAAWPI